VRVVGVTTRKRTEFIDVTSFIEKVIRESKVQEGVCIIFCPHTTAALTINENADPSVRKDIIHHLEELVPYAKEYSHVEGNADAHIKSSLLGSSLNIIIKDGLLVLGRWQGVYFCEFDGPRQRKLYIKVIKEK